MIIEQTRVLNIENHLQNIDDNEKFYIVRNVSDWSPEKLQRLIGLPQLSESGMTILPKIVGPTTRFNANGTYLILKNLPKETRYREICIKDWHGNYQYVDVPYKRYPRKLLPPPSIELKYIEDDENKYIVSPLCIKSTHDFPIIKHIINMFLEIFGTCELYSDGLKPIFKIPVKKVNWQILPKGNYPYERLLENIENILSNRTSKRKIQTHNIKVILKYHPESIVQGIGGFRGYLVFVFSKKNLFLMENVIYGNATYVFENEWERYSQMTKAEIINQSLQKLRIEHHAGWENQIKKLLQ